MKRGFTMKRSLRRFFDVTVPLAVVLYVVTGIAVTSSAQTVLRFGGSFPIDHHCTRGQEYFAKLVTGKTDKVKIEVYPASQLFNDKDLVRAVSTGAADMGILTPGVITGQVPIFLASDIPFLFSSRDHVHRWIDSEVGEIYREALKKKNFHMIYWIDFSIFGIASTKPIKTLEDFKGRRIRGVGEMAVEGLRALGAASTFISSSEVYLALQRNTIDGAISGWSTFYDRKYYEVTKYLTDPGLALGVMVVAMNAPAWEKLPKDVQDIIMAAGKEAQAWGRQECEKADSRDLEQLKKKGMEYYEVPQKERERWKEATYKTCTEVFLKRVEDQGKAKRVLELAEKSRK
ncbi:MAG: TRAP transporter substrate-binding protein [Desulfobacteraceae bacterium]|nr:MAG: TRAP transporter substrate-binding protein [Desulfobacteraceae bacterium]